MQRHACAGYGHTLCISFTTQPHAIDPNQVTQHDTKRHLLRPVFDPLDDGRAWTHHHTSKDKSRRTVQHQKRQRKNREAAKQFRRDSRTTGSQTSQGMQRPSQCRCMQRIHTLRSTPQQHVVLDQRSLKAACIECSAELLASNRTQTQPHPSIARLTPLV